MSDNFFEEKAVETTKQKGENLKKACRYFSFPHRTIPEILTPPWLYSTIHGANSGLMWGNFAVANSL
jgi:hypothetical protein